MKREHVPLEARTPERIILSNTVIKARRSRSSHDQEGADDIGADDQEVAFLFFPIFQGRALVSPLLTPFSPHRWT